MTIQPISSDSPLDLMAFLHGTNFRAWEYFGAHPASQDGQAGFLFRTWAPRAKKVSVYGDFNRWNPDANPLTRLDHGIWQGFVPNLTQYDTYKFAITAQDDTLHAKADPYAFHAETRPATASKLYDLSGYQWNDETWCNLRDTTPPYKRPLNIYECHLGSWRRTAHGEFLSYRDMARYLVPYVKELGFTHVEFLPVMEHPLDDSWGYQVTGFFAVTSRFGTPHDFMYLVDQLHQAGVGVILDWVPAHFPRDAFGLYHFDGSPTYEYEDPQKGMHQSWGTNVFDFGRGEVVSFLLSSAMFWLELFHADGLRVDAVSSMLYLDYDKAQGQWKPNIHGGNENLEAIAFLQKLNEGIFAIYPNALMIAEESTAFPKVTHPVYDGGLGFNYKWNMGWMNDLCHYCKLDPYFRQFNHKDITFSLVYAFSENYILPLSHDEVVHMKGSFFGKMPGEDIEKFAGVRAFYAYMLTHPGKKLTFMGAEFAQWNEWHFESSLDWHLLQNKENQMMHHFYKQINNFYLKTPALWQRDNAWDGFRWICADDNTANAIAFMRYDDAGNPLVIACNFSPTHHKGYRLGVAFAGTYTPIFNTDDKSFGGHGKGDQKPIKTSNSPCHDFPQHLSIDLPPTSVLIYQCTKPKPQKLQFTQTP